MEKVFEPLYGVDANNKIKEWTIRVDNMGEYSTITYTYGLKNGRRTECTSIVKSGKNIGKKNETTHFQQAILDAESKWKKKRDIDKYMTEHATDQNNQQTFLPMLAQDYTKHANKVSFPCYIQPKLDGYRMIFDGVKCTSRTGKEFTILSESDITKQLKRLFSLSSTTCLDGELYVHDNTFNFENYGILRKQRGLKPSEQHTLNRIEYHIYDIIDTSMIFEERLGVLREIQQKIEMAGLHKIKVVETRVCHGINEINSNHDSFIEDEYEGSIIRNKNGYYKCKYRSCDLLKYKNFDDGEFEIVGYTHEKDTKNGSDLIVWVCKTSNGQTFNVQSKGSREERQDLYKRGGEFIGKMLWVQHFGWTAEGIPRFPKTLREGISSIRMTE